jgi:aryl-alcohol dehydrogenase-like predicted oxidoreductase
MQTAMFERQQQLNDFQSLCDELNETPSAIALAWLLHQPGVSATIIGPGSVAQLSSVLHVPDIQLNDATLAQIDGIFPAVGESPEAYAW